MVYLRILSAWAACFLWLVFYISFAIGSTSAIALSSPYDATIVIEGDKSIKKVNRNIFGISLAKLHRQQWRRPVDFNSPKLKMLLEELSPTFISLDNTQLGLPFYFESTGKKPKRLSTLTSLERINLPQTGSAKQLFYAAARDSNYNQGQPPHKNYDDLLQYFGSLGSSPSFAIRIPIFFTDVQGVYRSLSHKLSPASGVDLIRYLNDPTDSPFGKLREKNGHKEPYDVQYIVLGNELWSNYAWENMTIDAIAGQIKIFSKEIKAIYPNIKLGVNLVDDTYPHRFFKPNAKKTYEKLIAYNRLLLDKINSDIDFVTFHAYGALGTEDLNKPLSFTQWQYILSQSFFKSRYGVPRKHTSFVENNNRDISISIDEFSGPTSTLGGAVYNADYIIHMLENNYDYATGWSLGIMEPDNHFGIIGIDSTSGSESFYRKPNFFTLKLFTHHMKGDMVSYSINSPTYSTKAIAWENYYNWPAEIDIPSLSMVSSRLGDKFYVIIVNKNIALDINTNIVFNGVSIGGNVMLSILSGDSPNSTQVDMIERSQTVEGNSLDLVVKRHSVVAIEFTPALSTPKNL
ncbi:hypothetical protein MNBD_GAMMA26-21 [hydrothermal vent metagenome]|uniref:Alpha-L-arabinofuranosidase 1 catalytic domain-containing protein n=1 Tax=hydrothermal vent metagenome TaxID=652676 RepID=A0A3B1BHR2_9ZZZZ